MKAGRRVPVTVLSVAIGVAAAAAAVPASSAHAPQHVLQGHAGLARAYDFILDARFDQVDAELRRACGPAPPEACNVLEAAALWWRLQLDPENRSRDPAFTASVERAIRTTQAWTDRAPEEPEAWFYLGGAYGARVQHRVLRGQTLAAARDGKQIKQALERAVDLEPSLEDAYFGLGMYKYYADVAPTAARILRFLLLLPGGDREEGLAEMRRARAHGRLLQGEADYQLHIIYLWYEQRPDLALELLQGLQARYPGNPLFPMQIAHVLEVYEHDLTASLNTWRTLLAAAEEGRINNAAIAEVYARLGAARMLDAIHQTDRAREHLEAIIARAPREPYSTLALAYLRLGEAHDRLGARPQAVAAYRSAIAAVSAPDPHDVRGQASARLRRAPDARIAEAFRLSLEGWRRFEQNDLPGAQAALARAVSLAPREPVARYRLGRVFQARRADVEALTEFEQAIREAETCPAPILGNAHLEAGRLHERLGDHDAALSAYTVASTLFGAASDTRAAARRALVRLTGEQEMRR